MTMKKFVLGFMLLASIFASGALILSCKDGGGDIDGGDPSGDPSGDPDGSGPNLVVAVWGRYLTVATSDALKADFTAYCASEGIAHGEITFRYKLGTISADPYYAVADFGQAVLDDGDVNIVLPVGSNIGTTGLLTALAGTEQKKILASVGDADTSSANRYIGYLTDDALTSTFYTDYIELQRAKDILAVDRRQ
jgi:hypothetical protein